MAQNSYRLDLTNAGRLFKGNIEFVATSAQHRFYRLDDQNLNSLYAPNIPSLVADLLDIAASIMWADRTCRRPRVYGTFRQLRGWVRHFQLTLGVRQPDFWNDIVVKETLEQLLHWLTEDHWELHFAHGPARRHSDIQRSMFSSPPSNALVVLYSGGLDSLAGVVNLAKRHPDKEIILISTLSSRLSGIVHEQVRLLQRILPSNHIKHADIPFNVVHDGKKEKEENTQRTRGLLFFSCGLVQAVVSQVHQVITCENGIGMLNLPFNKRQLGTQHTRSVHPRTFTYITRLLSLLNIADIRYEAPFMFSTKGEMCVGLREMGLGWLCAYTISCDSFSQRISLPAKVPGTEIHCGKCSSCLLRRQAIFNAQLENEDAQVSYQYDVCSPSWSHQDDEREPLLMMLDHVQLLKRACEASDPEITLLQEFPELSTSLIAIEQSPVTFGLAKDRKCIDALVDLFRRYIYEWERFPYHLF